MGQRQSVLRTEVDSAVCALVSACDPQDAALAARFIEAVADVETEAAQVARLSAVLCDVTFGTDAGAAHRRDIFATEAVRDGFFVPLVKYAKSAEACDWLSSAMCNITDGTDAGATRRQDIFATEAVRDGFFLPLAEHATSTEACRWLSNAMCNITNGTDAGAARRKDVFATEVVRDGFFVPLAEHATSTEAYRWLSSAMYNITRGTDANTARRRDVFATDAVRDGFFVPLMTTQWLIGDCSSDVRAFVAAADNLLALLQAFIGDDPDARRRMLSPALVAAVLPFANFPATSDAARALLPALRTFLLEQHPLCSTAPVSKTVIPKDTQSFWDLEKEFNAAINGHNDDYVKSRTRQGLLPLTFILVGATAVSNPVLEKRFEIMKSIMEKSDGYTATELREWCSFHGTRPKNIDGILTTSLVPYGHPLNPADHDSDGGWFGVNTAGVYVGRHVDYVLKYSNKEAPLKPDDEVDVIMFKTLPGKSKHIEKITHGLQPTPGFDSHSSPDYLEWYVFESAQLCPTHVLRVRAVENTRTKADDGLPPICI